MCATLLCVVHLRATQLRSMRGEIERRVWDLRCMFRSNSEMESAFQLSGLSGEPQSSSMTLSVLLWKYAGLKLGGSSREMDLGLSPSFGDFLGLDFFAVSMAGEEFWGRSFCRFVEEGTVSGRWRQICPIVSGSWSQGVSESSPLT